MHLPDIASSPNSQSSASLEWPQTSDLRTRPIYKDRALHYPYTCPSPPLRQTTGLAVGTQTKLTAAARCAFDAGYPINTMLTIRWRGLLDYDDLHPLRTMETPARIQYLVELQRKWLTRRRIPPFYLWVREVSDQAGEHWHLALHLPLVKRDAFKGYLETILIEPAMLHARAPSKRTRGEFACSDRASWQLAGEEPDGKPEFIGFWIAAYLGKGEPSERMFRGKLTGNTLKRIRGRECGGTMKDGRYDVPQGNIEGTTTRKGRFDIARNLK